MIQWRKSSRSNTSGGQCVKVANLAGKVGMRDSKALDTGHLTLSPETFTELVAKVKRDELNL
ncbi:DUF397 domain-containing protein [Actinomadura formosensis]|uniref:DUF397 domain-containing protein n=1 Tax=Actinomadura formosensis TaxID=60706 RepID=UPI000A020219|nr:DUF397 domain-containing protein [Actinomadura formosensis]